MLILIGPVAAAILTGLIGNALVQRWQQRNWYAQQRQTALQQELQELKSLLDEVTMNANRRLFTMKSLGAYISKRETPPVVLLDQYKTQVQEWNECLPSFYNKTTLLMGSGITYRLEHEVQSSFYESGRFIERSLRFLKGDRPVSTAQVAEISRSLERLNAASRNLFLTMSSIVVKKRHTIQNGRIVYYRSGDFSEYSTFNLFKALFVPDIDTLNIVRPA